MSSFLRSDRSQLAPPTSATIYEGRVARVHAPGDALMYSSGPEHRDIDELANIVQQLTGIKIYLGHPEVYPAEASGQKPVGVVNSGRLDDDTAIASMVITDESALAAVKAGTHELSLGYACGLDSNRYQRGIKLDHLAIVEKGRCGIVCAMRTDMLSEMPEKPKCECAHAEDPSQPCTCEHMVEDAELKSKERNALESESFAVPGSRKLPIHDEPHVRAAMSRFGQTEFSSSEEKSAAFHKILTKAHKLGIETEGFEKAWKGHMDSPEKICSCNSRATSYTTGETMSESNTDTLAEMTAEVEALKAKITALEVEATNARRDADAATAKLADAEAAVLTARSDAEAAVLKVKTDAAAEIKNTLDARVESRVALLVEAKAILPAETELCKMSDRDIKIAVIKHVDGDDVAADKVDAYVDGVYAGSLKRGAKANGSREDARITLNQMRKDGAPLSAQEREKLARDKMNNESATAWAKKN